MTFSSVKFKPSKIVEMVVFDLLRLAKIDFTLNQRGRTILKCALNYLIIRTFSQCENSRFFFTQILREINFSHFEASKTAILAILVALNFQFLAVLTFSSVKFPQKWKFEATKFVKMAIFDLLKSTILISRNIWVSDAVWKFEEFLPWH